ELGALEEQLLVTGRRGLHVDGREHPAGGEAPVELELHVPGALELLEDDLVHAAAGLDERRGEDREAAALLEVAGRPEELLRRVEGAGVEAARGGPTGRRDGQVV